VTEAVFSNFLALSVLLEAAAAVLGWTIGNHMAETNTNYAFIHFSQTRDIE